MKAVGGACIHFKLNLKTGFFKSEPYIATVTGAALTLVRNQEQTGESKNIIPCGEVQSIVIFRRSPAELEVKTEKEVFIGTLQEPVDLVAVAEVLRKVFGARFLQV